MEKISGGTSEPFEESWTFALFASFLRNVRNAKGVGEWIVLEHSYIGIITVQLREGTHALLFETARPGRLLARRSSHGQEATGALVCERRFRVHCPSN